MPIAAISPAPARLAEEACDIEIDTLGKPIGRQDQYAAAFGGVNYITFNPDHSVKVEPVPYKPETLKTLQDWSLLLYTHQQRSADDILQKQSEGTADRLSVLKQMRDLAGEMRGALSGGDLDEFARQLREGWELKRSLGFGIATDQVNEWYEAACGAGALGGKLLGAGGGGFFHLFAPPERHDAIREALGRPKELPFAIDHSGSRVIFISDRYAF